MAKNPFKRCHVIMAVLAMFISSCPAAPVDQAKAISTSSGCNPDITYIWTTKTLPHIPYDSTSTVIFLLPAPTEPPSSASSSSSAGNSRIKTVKVTKTITPSNVPMAEEVMAVSSVPAAAPSSAGPALARRSSLPDDTIDTTVMVAEPSVHGHLPDKIITVTTTVTGTDSPPPPTSKTLVMVVVTVVESPGSSKTMGSKPIVPMVAKRTWDDYPHGPPGDHPFHHGQDTWGPATAVAATTTSSLSTTSPWSISPSSASFETSYGAKPTSATNDKGNHNNNKKNHDNGNGNGNAAAQGTAYVINKCSFGVMSNIVHGTSGADSNGVPPEEIMSSVSPGQTVSHPFSHDPSTGVSWKIWRTDGSNQAPVQFEYTWIPEAKRTWWDLSMIDAGKVDWLETAAVDEDIVGDQDGYGAYVGRVGVKHAFVNEGMSLVPSVQNGICEAVVCRPGEQFCTTAYNVWNDWGQQRDCAENVDLTLTLCG